MNRVAVLLSFSTSISICLASTMSPSAVGSASRLGSGRTSGMPAADPTPWLTTGDPDDVYWDNRLSPAFAGVDDRVSAIASYQGELIVGGAFTVAGGVVALGIAAWNGSAWFPLGAGAGWEVPGSPRSGGAVRALVVYDGKLIAGGSFDRMGDVEANSIAAWDGTSWTPLGTGVEGGSISALTVYDGKLIAGGNFTSAGGMDARGIAAWDGSTWLPMGPVSSAYHGGWVDALAVYGDRLVAGGPFDAIGGVPAERIAAWDGESWSAMGPGLTASAYGGVYALTVHEDRLIAGGDFTAAGGTPVGHLAAWDGTSWTALGPGVPWYVFDLSVFGSRLIAGGGEDTSTGRELRLVSWDGESWTSMTPAFERANESIYDLCVFGNKLVVGGVFRAVDGMPTASVAAWDGTSWSGFSPGRLGVSGPVQSLAIYNHRLVAGGTFVTAGSGVASHIAAWDGATWSPLGPGVPSLVSAIAAYQGRLIAGGGGVSAWNGSVWAPMSPEVILNWESWVACLSTYENDLFVSEAWRGCTFGPCELPGEAVVAYWEDTSLFPVHGFNEPVLAFTTYGNRLVAGGEFSRAAGQPASHIASWDGLSWSAVGGGTNGTVSALAVFENRLIAAGSFTSAGGVPARNIAAWDGASWSALGDGVALHVNALAVYDGKLIAGGGVTFSVNQGSLNSWDGQSWSPLGSGTNGVVSALTVSEDGLVVAGNFTMAGGKPSPYLALWTKKQGVKEVAIDVRPGSCPNPINVNAHSAASQAVIPVAILGTAGFEVLDIDPGSVTLEGVHALRWNYTDVAAPGDDSESDCNCTTEGPDGFGDLELLFSRRELTAVLDAALSAAPAGTGPRGRSTHESHEVNLNGICSDGTAIEGSDCVEFVGGRKAFLAPEQSVRDLQVRSLPNSAGPSVQISFTLTGAAHVRVAVYNVLGQEVASLIDESRGPGRQFIVWKGDRVASGIYYCRVQADRDVQVTQMMLLK